MGTNFVTRTPCRISFVGGGTDIAYFYRNHGGAVISTAINKYVTVTIESNDYGKIIIDTESYRVISSGEPSREAVYSYDQITHPYIREALRLTGLGRGTSVKIRSDTKAGSGLGGSSALTVGLMSAIHAYKNVGAKTEAFARMACEIEIDVLGNPIGKQDQYIAAYGGLKLLDFLQDGEVIVTDISEHADALQPYVMLFDTGITRDANTILYDQRKIADIKGLEIIRSHVDKFLCYLLDGDVESMGRLLNSTWAIKQNLSPSISSGHLNSIYTEALKAGALGGKILGAGGGGHFMFIVPTDSRVPVIEALEEYATHVPFEFESEGSILVD